MTQRADGERTQRPHPVIARVADADRMQRSASGLALPFPTTRVDARVALATAMHAGPGVYAVLVGDRRSRVTAMSGWPERWDRRPEVQAQLRRDVLARPARATQVRHRCCLLFAAHDLA